LRAKAMKINLYSENGLPYFIRRISESSLVYSYDQEESSEYIEKLMRKTEKRLAEKKYVAEKKALTLKLLT
jgi:hypothetical protein